MYKVHILDIDRRLKLVSKKKELVKVISPFAKDYEGHEDRPKEREEDEVTKVDDLTRLLKVSAEAIIYIQGDPMSETHLSHCMCNTNAPALGFVAALYHKVTFAVRRCRDRITENSR